MQENKITFRILNILAQYFYLLYTIFLNTSLFPQKWQREQTYKVKESAAACSFHEAVAVGTFGDSGVILMSTHAYAVKGTIVLSHHIMLALRNGTFDIIIFSFIVFHNRLLIWNRQICAFIALHFRSFRFASFAPSARAQIFLLFWNHKICVFLFRSRNTNIILHFPWNIHRLK